MAFALKFSTVDEETMNLITRVCVVTPAVTQYNDSPEPVACFAINKSEDRIYLPLGVWTQFLNDPPERKWPRTKVKCLKEPFTTKTDPKGYRDQNVVVEEAWDILKNDRVVFLALATGFGKTSLGNYFCGKTKFKTLVLCHMDEVNAQWVQEFEKFSTAKVQFLKGVSSGPGKKGKKFDPEADVYVGGIKKVSGMDRSMLAGIGLVILDEAHISTITAFSSALLRVRPKYVIALSATPKRSDGMEKLFKMYFGPSNNYILRRETKDFVVRKVVTGFKPKLKYQIFKGRATPNWTILTNSISEHTPVHDFVVESLSPGGRHENEVAIVMSKRVEECEAIYERLRKILPEGEVELFVGKTDAATKARIKARKYRILVGSSQKCGTGYDDDRIFLGFLLSDHRNVEQYEGRLRTTNCTIYDFVSDYKTLENHWKLREKWFRTKGATIEIIDLKWRSVGAAIGPEKEVRRGPKNTEVE